MRLLSASPVSWNLYINRHFPYQTLDYAAKPFNSMIISKSSSIYNQLKSLFANLAARVTQNPVPLSPVTWEIRDYTIESPRRHVLIKIWVHKGSVVHAIFSPQVYPGGSSNAPRLRPGGDDRLFTIQPGRLDHDFHKAFMYPTAVYCLHSISPTLQYLHGQEQDSGGNHWAPDVTD